MASFYYLFFISMEKKLIKLKILYTIPNFDTAGSGKALLNVAKNLDQNIFEPHISCSHNKGDFFKKVEESGFFIHLKTTTHKMMPRLKGIKKCFDLAIYFKSLNIDLIHSFHYGDDYSEALSAKIAGIPWVYTKKNMNWGGKSKNAWVLRSFLAKHILVQNTDMLKEFFSKSKKVSLVPRGVDTKEFFPKKSNRKLLDLYKIKNTDNIIVCVANLHPVKGIEILINSFMQISEKFKPAYLFIIGYNKTKYGESLKKMALKNKNIYFTGKINNVSDYYSIGKLFVLPTLNIGRREGCPVALLEALASGLQVLGSNVSGIKDVLNEFQENLFIEGNSEELKKKIEKQLGFKNNIKNLNMLNHTIKNYDIRIEAVKHEKIYSSIIKKK